MSRIALWGIVVSIMIGYTPYAYSQTLPPIPTTGNILYITGELYGNSSFTEDISTYDAVIFGTGAGQDIQIISPAPLGYSSVPLYFLPGSVPQVTSIDGQGRPTILHIYGSGIQNLTTISQFRNLELYLGSGVALPNLQSLQGENAPGGSYLTIIGQDNVLNELSSIMLETIGEANLIINVGNNSLSGLSTVSVIGIPPIVSISGGYGSLQHIDSLTIMHTFSDSGGTGEIQTAEPIAPSTINVSALDTLSITTKQYSLPVDALGDLSFFNPLQDLLFFKPNWLDAIIQQQQGDVGGTPVDIVFAQEGDVLFYKVDYQSFTGNSLVNQRPTLYPFNTQILSTVESNSTGSIGKYIKLFKPQYFQQSN